MPNLLKLILLTHFSEKPQGFWDNKQFEIGSAENGTSENIRNALKHCASKKEAEIAVIYFTGNFNIHNFHKGLARFMGLKKSPGSQFKDFDLILCIQNKKIVHVYKK